MPILRVRILIFLPLSFKFFFFLCFDYQCISKYIICRYFLKVSGLSSHPLDYYCNFIKIYLCIFKQLVGKKFIEILTMFAKSRWMFVIKIMHFLKERNMSNLNQLSYLSLLLRHCYFGFQVGVHFWNAYGAAYWLRVLVLLIIFHLICYDFQEAGGNTDILILKRREKISVPKLIPKSFLTHNFLDLRDWHPLWFIRHLSIFLDFQHQILTAFFILKKYYITMTCL